MKGPEISFCAGRKITKLQAHLHGSGSFQAGDLPVDEAIISHHGNGLVEISPERWLDARIRKTETYYFMKNRFGWLWKEREAERSSSLI